MKAGRLRSKPPMWQPGRSYREAYRRPINAGIRNGHVVFFIHGGLNDTKIVTERIRRFSEEFKDEPGHLVHLAWDTGWGSALDDIIAELTTLRSWSNIIRLLGFLLPWNWFGYRRVLRGPAAHFGGILWKSEYDTAVAATRPTRLMSRPRNRGFYRAFKYLNDRVKENDGVQISFVVESAGSIVANYLLTLISMRFRKLAGRVRNYILLAPACHVTHFQESMSSVRTGHQTAVLALTPQLEERDSMAVYDRSILWAVHDLFEARWKQNEFKRFRLPIRSPYPISDPWNRSILGIEQQIADLEARGTDALDRSFGGRVGWAHTDESVSIGGSAPRVWTKSTTHTGFDEDPTTLESIKLLLR